MGNMKGADEIIKKSVDTKAIERPEADPKEDPGSEKSVEVPKKGLRFAEAVYEVFLNVEARILNGDYNHLLSELSDDYLSHYSWEITAQYDGTLWDPEVSFTVKFTRSTDENIATIRELPEIACERIRQHKL